MITNVEGAQDDNKYGDTTSLAFTSGFLENLKDMFAR